MRAFSNSWFAMAFSMRCTMNLIRFWTSVISSGNEVWRSFTRAPASSMRSIALSGRKRSGIYAIGMRYSEVDGVVGVSDRVELLVAVLNAEQNLGGVAFIRRRNLDGLETALERTVFFDRLAILARRSRADTLNFTARQSRFQDVGRV